MKRQVVRFKKMSYSRDELESWIPSYLNGSLDAEQRRILEEWLRTDDRAVQDLESWSLIRSVVSGRHSHEPAPKVWSELVEKIDRGRQRAPGPGIRSYFPSLISGVLCAVLSLLVLWLVIRPGILLQWSISEPSAISYRIYRAPASSGVFSLVDELPGELGVRDYRYLDTVFVPGVPYIYRIEGMNAADKLLFSNAVLSATTDALPGEMAILIASALVGLLAARLVQGRRWGNLLMEG